MTPIRANVDTMKNATGDIVATRNLKTRFAMGTWPFFHFTGTHFKQSKSKCNWDGWNNATDCKRPSCNWLKTEMGIRSAPLNETGPFNSRIEWSTTATAASASQCVTEHENKPKENKKQRKKTNMKLKNSIVSLYWSSAERNTKNQYWNWAFFPSTSLDVANIWMDSTFIQHIFCGREWKWHEKQTHNTLIYFGQPQIRNTNTNAKCFGNFFWFCFVLEAYLFQMLAYNIHTYRYARKIQSAKLMKKFQSHIVTCIIKMIQLKLNWRCVFPLFPFGFRAAQWQCHRPNSIIRLCRITW